MKDWIEKAETRKETFRDPRKAFWEGYVQGLLDIKTGKMDRSLSEKRPRNVINSELRERIRGYRLGLQEIPFEEAQRHEAILLPPRVHFVSHTFTFKQPKPPHGYDLKILIRNKAKKLVPYRLPVVVYPEVTGRDDEGNPIPVNTLGRWLFGIPGFKGHIRVIPMREKIEVHLFLPEKEKVKDIVLDLLEAVFKKMRLERLSSE